MISVDALLFDLDGTLIDSKKDITRSVQYLQELYGVKASTSDQVASFIGDGVVKLVQRALPRLKGERLKGAVEQFKKYYRVHALDSTRLYPHAREVIRHFRHKKLAVVTNKPVRISRDILDGLGVLSHFAMVVGGDSVRHKKPDPQPIRWALHHLRVHPPKHAVVVGDGANDILSGHAAGTWTCAVASKIGRPPDGRTVRPDFAIRTLMGLTHLFR